MIRQAKYGRKKRAEGSDIGQIPSVVNPMRRESCKQDLALFLTTYFPKTTGLSPFGPDHLRAILRLQNTILNGGLTGNVLPRGFAKTTISENSAIWAVAYGHRRFVPIFGADETAAMENIGSIKKELESNELLLEDFPEICYPIQALDGKPQRAASQTHVPGNFEGTDPPAEGTASRPTAIIWRSDTIVLPHVIMPSGRPSVSSGLSITTRGLGSGARGMKHKMADGTQQRPDFVIIDDPQTEQSAESPTQINKRLAIIQKSILRLGSHTNKIAVCVNATIIQPQDLIETMMDRKRFPAWQFLRIAMVPKLPDAHQTLWLEDYRDLRNNYDKDKEGDRERAAESATQFYIAHRTEMDAGSVVSWDHCFIPGIEISTLQHAYNILIDEGPETFASECQNQPISSTDDGTPQLKPMELIKRLNKVDRGVVPNEYDKLTAFIDVQGEALYWMVCGWNTETFAGSVIDYGVWPKQGLKYFGLANLTNPLSSVYPGMEQGAMLLAGLNDLINQLTSRVFVNEAKIEIPLARGFVDYGWEKSEAAVFAACRGTKELWIPSKGKGVPATQTPFDQYNRPPGVTIGRSWRISRKTGQAKCLFETNHWKTFVRDCFMAPMGSKTHLALFGSAEDAHRMLVDHLAGERCQLVTVDGRTVLQWDNEANREQHWWDGVVGCAAAASTVGVHTPEAIPMSTGQPRSLKAMQAMRRSAR